MAILVILMFFRRINSVTRPKVLKLGFELSRKVILIYRLGPRFFLVSSKSQIAQILSIARQTYHSQKLDILSYIYIYIYIYLN